jgi:hypothetical protein
MRGQETAQMHFDRAKKITKDLTGDHATTARNEKSIAKD